MFTRIRTTLKCSLFRLDASLLVEENKRLRADLDQMHTAFDELQVISHFLVPPTRTHSSSPPQLADRDRLHEELKLKDDLLKAQCEAESSRTESGKLREEVDQLRRQVDKLKVEKQELETNAANAALIPPPPPTPVVTQPPAPSAPSEVLSPGMRVHTF